MKLAHRKITIGSLFTHGVSMLGLLCLGTLEAFAASHGEARSEFNHNRSDLGMVNLGSEVTQTTKGPMQFVGRIVDSVRSETIDGCRLGLAITNSPHSPKLHVLVDGKPVPGYDDVAWHSLVFSPNGKHFAFVANKDGKKVCVRDGVAGRAYEQIGRYGTDSGQALSFSPDGLHLGYAARENGNWFVVLDDVAGPDFDSVDGMMLTRYEKKDVDGFAKWESKTWGGSDCPQFSSDGRHVFYLGQRKNDKGITSYVLVLDGKPGPEYEGFWGAHLCPNGEVAYVGINGFDAQVVFDGVPEIAKGGSTLIFSRDGKHHAYIAGKAGSGNHAVVFDGKPGPHFESIENLQFSPDGHVFYQTFSESSGWRLVRDEALVPPVDGYRVSRVYFGQDGQRTVYLGEKRRDGGDMAFISDDKAVPFKSSNFLYFVSPDARRLVFETRTPEGRHLVVDGIPGPAVAGYINDSLKFTADSRRFAYIAHDANYRQSVVVDGQVGPSYYSIEKGHPFFDPAGAHYAYAARAGSEWVVVLDGVPGPTLKNVDLSSLRFSPDGRLAYSAEIGAEQAVVINTTPGPLFSQIQPGSLSFSPDGKHLAYVAITVTPSNPVNTSPSPNLPLGVKRPVMKTLKKQVVFDGVPGPSLEGIGAKNVVFSSDSQHWTYTGQKNGHESVYIDGVAGPEFFTIEVGPQQRADGQLEYLASEGDYVSRKLVRVTVKGFASVKP